MTSLGGPAPLRSSAPALGPQGLFRMSSRTSATRGSFDWLSQNNAFFRSSRSFSVRAIWTSLSTAARSFRWE